MAGSSISNWMLGLLLSLFFIFSHQMYIGPNCRKELWVTEFQKDLKALGSLVKECPGNCSLGANSNSPNSGTTGQKTRAFADRFIERVEYLLQQQYLNKSTILNVQRHVEKLKVKLPEACDCKELVEQFCSNDSPPIVSLKDLHTRMETLMMKYRAEIAGADA